MNAGVDRLTPMQPIGLTTPILVVVAKEAEKMQTEGSTKKLAPAHISLPNTVNIKNNLNALRKTEPGENQLTEYRCQSDI